MTTVRQLKDMIENLPDDALVLTDTPHSVIEAQVRVGSAREPDSMGFTYFIDDDDLAYPAVYVYAPLT